MQRRDQEYTQTSSTMIRITKSTRFDAIHENQRSQAKNHSKSETRQLSSENRKNDRDFFESLTINQVNQEQKSSVARSLQDAHSQV